MSYILEALKKSEVERKRSAEQNLLSGIQTPRAPRYATERRLPYVISGIVFLAVVLGIFLITGRSNEISSSANKIKAERNIPNAIPDPVMKGSENTLPAKTGSTLQGYTELPFLWEKPKTYRNGIDSLVVSIHVYSAEPTQRILFINDREYKVGEITKQGPKIVSIEPQGVILSYRNEYFKLPRPR